MEKQKAYEEIIGLLDKIYAICTENGFALGIGLISPDLEKITTYAVNMSVARWSHILIESLPDDNKIENLGNLLCISQKSDGNETEFVGFAEE